MKDDTKVDVDVMVKERPMKTADVDLSWGLAPNSNGIPLPADKFPGGSLTFENRNLGGQGNQFSASITSENFLQPNDDVGFKVGGLQALGHAHTISAFGLTFWKGCGCLRGNTYCSICLLLM